MSSDPEKNIIYPKQFDNENLLKKSYLSDESEDQGGDDGEGGWDGTAPLVDPSIFGLTNHFFMEMLREAERKFSQGQVPFTQDPNKKVSGTPGEGPPPHPLISQSQKFSGDDPKITADATNSEQAQELYPELRNELALTHTPRPSSAPTFKPL